MNNLRLTTLSIMLMLLFVCGCGKKEEIKNPVRAVKTVTITEQASGQLRKFSGVIYAVDNSKLSFEDVSGRVDKVNVDIGDSVKKGDILAVLDKEKYQLDVTNNQAELKKAEANLVKADSDFKRADELYTKQVISKKELDTRTYQLEAAKSGVGAAKANLGQAERNLRNTTLRAPFDGSIGERMIEPQQSVALSQKIFRLDAKGALEIQFDIPEGMRKRVKLQDTGSVTFSGQPGIVTKCKISFLGTAAVRGNAFPAKAQLVDPPQTVKPGMTAEISLILPVAGDVSGFLLPPAAYLPGPNPKSGIVFLYDPTTSTVKKVQVKAGGSSGNLGIVVGGLNQGDIVVVAGVSFLKDGMKVKLYKPAANKGE